MIPCITIPLIDYIHALMGVRDHAIIDDKQKTSICSVPGYEKVARIEDTQAAGLYFLYEVKPDFIPTQALIETFIELYTKLVGDESLKPLITEQAKTLSREQLEQKITALKER